MAEENNNNAPEGRKKAPKKSAPGAPAWMVTYSDLVTLLLTFFVLLMSMASLDPVRFTEASSSLKDAFGMHAQPSHVEFAIPVLPAPPITQFKPVHTEMTDKIYRRIKAQIEDLELDKDVEAILQDSDTIILRINSTVLFAPGDARLSPQSYPQLRRLADLIRPLPTNLRIEGHTDDQLAKDAALNNWDLSIARAVSVTRFFEQSSLLPLDRMAAIGYGAARPLVANVSDDNRAKNRRVDFVLQVKGSSGMSPADTDTGKVPL